MGLYGCAQEARRSCWPVGCARARVAKYALVPMQDSKYLCLVFCGHCVREVRCVRAMLAFTYCMYAGACKRTRVRAYVCQRRAQRHVGTRCLCPRRIRIGFPFNFVDRRNRRDWRSPELELGAAGARHGRVSEAPGDCVNERRDDSKFEHRRTGFSCNLRTHHRLAVSEAVRRCRETNGALSQL